MDGSGGLGAGERKTSPGSVWLSELTSQRPGWPHHRLRGLFGMQGVLSVCTSSKFPGDAGLGPTLWRGTALRTSNSLPTTPGRLGVLLGGLRDLAFPKLVLASSNESAKVAPGPLTPSVKERGAGECFAHWYT